MKIFQVERIVPDLIQGSSVERRFPHLKFNDEHHRAKQQDSIHSATHTWDIKLQEECT